jgi:hypothetical protein
MRRPLFIVLLAALAAATLVTGACWLTQRLCRTRETADQLDWLRTEFQLNTEQMARIRELHNGYLPKCAEFCAQIAALQHELDQILSQKGADSPAVEQKLAEIGAIRARCQATMLRHFVEVSRVMPAEQGKRYLAEMQRLTIGAHERIEATMSGGPSHHDDH